MKKFIALMTETLKGISDEITAKLCQKKAAALLKAQIAIKEAELLTLEADLDAAKDAQLKVRLNHEVIQNKDGKIYLQSLLDAREAVEVAQEAIENLQYQITVFTEELKFVTE